MRLIDENPDTADAARVRYRFLVALAAVLLLALVLLLMRQPEPVAPVNLSVPATPAPEVKRVAKVDKPLKAKAVKVYPAAVKNALKLPSVVMDDPAREVIASSRVKADDHPQTVTTLINVETGDSETFVRRDPLPLIAWDTRGHVGAYIGFKNTEPALRLEARQDIFDLKALRFGAIASVDVTQTGKTDTFIGVGAAWHW